MQIILSGIKSSNLDKTINSSSTKSIFVDANTGASSSSWNYSGWFSVFIISN